MGTEQTPGKPTTRRYSDEEKAQAVRLVRQLRAETGQTLRGGEAGRGAARLRRGICAELGEPGRHRKRDPSGHNQPGWDADQRARAGVRELRRANEILKKASAFFAAELDRPQKI